MSKDWWESGAWRAWGTPSHQQGAGAKSGGLMGHRQDFGFYLEGIRSPPKAERRRTRHVAEWRRH